MKKVKVTFPDGSEADIDESDLQAALSAGAKRSGGASAANVKSTSMVFPDGSIADINDNDIQSATQAGAVKKKDGSNGVTAEPNTSSTTPVVATSPSASSTNSFGQYDAFNNPLNVQPKSIVSVAGVPVPVSDLPETSVIPTISSQKDLAQQLQARINTKTYNPKDVEVVAQSMKVSVPAANAYMEGKLGTGTVIHFNDIKAAKQDVLKSTVLQANQELGRNDSYDDVFTSADVAGAYLQKIQQLYDAKATQQSVLAVEQTANANPVLFGEGLSNVNDSEAKSTMNAAQKIKGIISNDIIDKISADTTLNTDQKVKKIYNLVDPRDKISTEKAIGKRLEPLNYMINVATSNSNVGTGTTDDIDLLNSTKAKLEFQVNRSLGDQVKYNEALKRSIAEEYASKISSNEISPDDQKAKDEYSNRIADVDSKNTQISKGIVSDKDLYVKYPTLHQSALAGAVNDFNAIQSGNVVGYEDDGYKGVSLKEYLTAKGFDTNDQKVKDFVSGDNFKDYSFFGRPLQNVADVFTNTGKAILDLTPLRDDATILAEKKRAEIFPTQVGSNDEFQLTTSAGVGQNVGNTTGQVIGQGLLQAGTFGLGRMAGLSKVAAMNAAFWSSGTLTSYDQAYKDSYDFIDNTLGRTAYAGLIALSNGASEKIFPDVKLLKIPGVSDAIAKLASKVGTKELTNDLADDLLGKAKNEFVDYALKYGRNVGQETVEEVATDLFESGTRYLFGDPNISVDKAMESARNTAIQTAIGTSLIGGFGAFKDVQEERNVAPKSTIYNSAIYHDQASDAINLGFEEGAYGNYERDAKFSLLNTARQSVDIMTKTEQIEGKTLSRPERELYVANLTAEAALTGQKKDMDEVAQKSIDEKISNLQNQRQQILKGEVNIDEDGNITEAVTKPVQTQVGTTEVPNAETAVSPSVESANTVAAEPATAVLTEDNVPDITVSEMIDKPGIYQGQKGSFSQDGQTVIFKVNGQNKEYELGNVNDIKDRPISDFGIEHETSVVGFDDAGNIKVRDESYVNNFSNPLQAINRDANGNVVSVNLETTDGKKRTFRGNVAEDVAYQIHLKEITKDNETRNNFENFINTDPSAQEEINNAGVSETTTQVADTTNGEVQREKIEPISTTPVLEGSDVNKEHQKELDILSNPKKGDMVSVDIGGGKFEKQEIINVTKDGVVFKGQFSATPIEDAIKEVNAKYESENKPIQNEANQQTNTENQQGNIQTEAAQPTDTAVGENAQQADPIERAKELVNSGVVKGFTAEVLKESANNNPAEFNQHLKDISEQAQDPNSKAATIKTYGQELVDIANELNPKSTEVDNSNKNIPPEESISEADIPKSDGVGIVHAATSDLREEFGLPEYGKEAQTFEGWDAEADQRIKNGEMQALLDKLRNNYQPSAVEVRMMGKYIAYLKGVVSETRSNENIAKLNEAIQLSDSIGGTENARGLVARKGLFIDEGTLADYFQNELEAAKVDELTDEQKAVVEKEHAEISQAQKEWDVERDRLNKQIKDLQAQQELDKNKPKKKATSATKKTHEDYVKEREAIVAHLKDKLRQARSGTNVTVIPYAADLFAAAPDVARLVKSLVEEGVSKLGDVIDNVHSSLKDGIPDITKDDVRDLIAGVYNEPRKTRNQTAQELFELKQEAKLINQLLDLQNGKQPVTNSQQIKYNQQIKDLKAQIAKFRKENISDATKLNALKSRYQTEIKKVEEELKTGSFLTPTPPSAPVKLDKAALDAKDKLIKLKNERQLRLLREQYANRPLKEKAMSIAGNILNIPRALMTTLDFSAVLRQGVIPTVSHPVLAYKAGVQMFKSAWTQEEYDRWFYDLENSPRYNLKKESGLALTDNTNPNLTVREEDFMSNLAEKIPIVGQQLKTKWGTIPGANLLRKSERAYAAYINKIRSDLFDRFADSMEYRGMTFENSPEQYKGVADYINNATGRGSLGPQLDNIAPLLNGIFFSPRLIAARLNMLTYFAQPRFYTKVPVEVRKAYFADMGKFLAVGASVLGLAALAGKDDDPDKEMTVETDPRSSDFGKIKQGQTRWDIWGGFQPFIRVVAQVYTGERKSTNTDRIYSLSGDGPFGQNRWDVINAFVRGKLAPVPSMAVDIFSRRTAVGEKILLDEFDSDNAKPKEITITKYLKDHILPLSYSGVKDAYDEKGATGIFSVGVPSIFGVGTQTYTK